jgi:hypothetical protein
MSAEGDTLEEINKSEDILNVLFDYVTDYFNEFGHHGGSNLTFRVS